MCTYSMIADHYRISKKEFDDLKRQVEEMKELLKKAADYDRRNNKPECEIAFLRKVAEFVGVPNAVVPPNESSGSG